MADDVRKNNLTFLRPADPPVEDLPETFIDRYRDWAHTKTDSPIQYHESLGAAILSTMMAPHVRLRTDRSEPIVPNIWVMILAGTTMARKTTTIKMATRLLDDVVDDWMLATDGTPEGIMTELGYRDGKVSVFLRDEVTGFISNLSRDYMSDTLESFCKLYDGSPVTRLLRREKIEVKNPFFVFVGGGIKTAMEEMVSMDQIRSGFIPRFIFVIGNTTPEEVQLVGPPKDDEIEDDSDRDDLVNELWNIHHYYNQDDTSDETAVVKIAGIVKMKAAPRKRLVSLKGTPAFWKRYQDLQRDVMQLGIKTSYPELYAPLYTRLANSIVKVAVLLAGADMNGTIDATHLQKALYFGQHWLESTTEFAANIEQRPEMDRWEKKAEKIVQWVKNMHPKTVTQTEAMQKMRIRKRDISDIEDTLMARGAITITPYPHKRDAKGGSIIYSVAENVPPVTSRIQREDTFRVNGKEQGYAEARGGRRIRFPISTEDDPTIDYS